MPVSLVAGLLVFPAHNKQTEAASAGRACPPGGRGREERRGAGPGGAGPAGRGLLLPAPHLRCSPLAPSPADPEAKTAAGTPFDRRAQTDCAPPRFSLPLPLSHPLSLSLGLSVSLCAFSHSVDMDRQL